LAAPAANAVVADCDRLDLTKDEALLAKDLFVPGLRKIGAFEGAAALAAPNPLLLHNVGKNFSTDYLRETYDGVQATKAFRVDAARQNEDEIVKWIVGL